MSGFYLPELTTLENFPEKLRSLDLGCPKLTSLDYLPEVSFELAIAVSDRCHLLKLLLSKADFFSFGLYPRNNSVIDDIINKYRDDIKSGNLTQRKALLACQSELIKAGFVENAQL